MDNHAPLDPTTGRRRTGRPPVLSRADIARAALDQISDLSIAKVAKAAGVSPSSLYHHVSGRSELILVAADRAFRDVQWPTPSGPDDWRGYLETLADTYLRLFLEHPGLALALQELDRVPASAIDAARDSVRFLTSCGFIQADCETALALASHLAADAALFDAARADVPPPPSDVFDAGATSPRANMRAKLSMVLDGLETRLPLQG